MEKINALVISLLTRTKTGALAWEQGNLQNSFEVSFANSSIRLRQVDRLGSETDYIINILNSEGEIVDNFSDVEIDQKGFQHDGISAFGTLDKLYTLVRRNVSGADRILDDIMKELSGR